MAERVDAPSRRSRERERGKRVRLTARAYLAATAGPRRQPGFGRRPLPLEGFLFPATYDFTRANDLARSSSPRSSRPSARNWAKVNLALRALEEPDAVRRADHRLDDREGDASRPRSGSSSSAVIYNRLHERMPLGIDATLRYGLHIPPTESITQSQLDSHNPVQHAQRDPGPAADADREPRARLAPGGRAPGAGRLPLLRRASRTRSTTSSRRARPRSSATRPTHGYRDRRRDALVALLGHPVAELALAADAERGLRRAGLDWAYVAARRRAGRAGEAVAGWSRAGFAGANVTIPHKQAVGGALRRGRGRVGEHARLPRRPRARLQHRQGDRGRDRGRARLPDRRGRCGAGAAARRCRARCACSRAAASGRPTPPAAT